MGKKIRIRNKERKKERKRRRNFTFSPTVGTFFPGEALPLFLRFADRTSQYNLSN